MVCCGSFPSFLGENHPEPKSNQDQDPDKLVCTFFLDLCSRLLTIATNPRVTNRVTISFNKTVVFVQNFNLMP